MCWLNNDIDTHIVRVVDSYRDKSNTNWCQNPCGQQMWYETDPWQTQTSNPAGSSNRGSINPLCLRLKYDWVVSVSQYFAVVLFSWGTLIQAEGTIMPLIQMKAI